MIKKIILSLAILFVVYILLIFKVEGFRNFADSVGLEGFNDTIMSIKQKADTGLDDFDAIEKFNDGKSKATEIKQKGQDGIKAGQEGIEKIQNTIEETQNKAKETKEQLDKTIDSVNQAKDAVNQAKDDLDKLQQNAKDIIPSKNNN